MVDYTLTNTAADIDSALQEVVALTGSAVGTSDTQTLTNKTINSASNTISLTASVVSDFDTEVSNNTDVAANTSARHDAVTVSDSSEIDFTLTGQDITASLIAGSIDETKLDVSVNASLDLADSAVQSLSDLSITATATELNYVDGVTSAIQTQLNAKAPIANPTFTGEIGIGAVNVSETELGILEGATVTTAELNILDGVTSTAAELNKLDGVTATTTELNYVDGVTSAIQTQLDGKPDSDTSGITGADAITNIVSLTTAEYTAIGTPDASTLYIITDA